MMKKVITLLLQDFLPAAQIIQLWLKNYCRLQLLSSDLNTIIILTDSIMGYSFQPLAANGEAGRREYHEPNR